MQQRLEEYKYINQEIAVHQRLIIQIFTISLIASVVVVGYGLQQFTSTVGPFVMLIPMAIIIPCAFLISGLRRDIFRLGAYVMVMHENDKKPGYETLLDKVRDNTGSLKESLTPIVLTYCTLGVICAGLFVHGVRNIELVPDKVSWLAIVPLLFLGCWAYRYIKIPSKPNRDKLKEEWREAKRVLSARDSVKSGSTDGKSFDTPAEHSSLKDIEEHLKKQDRQGACLTFAAFGGSIVLVGITLWVGRLLLFPDSYKHIFVFLIVVGLGTMFASLFLVRNFTWTRFKTRLYNMFKHSSK